MPTLEVDGQVAHQSVAILRYLGKRFELTGSNAWEELLVDSVADTFADFRQSNFKSFCEFHHIFYNHFLEQNS